MKMTATKPFQGGSSEGDKRFACALTVLAVSALYVLTMNYSYRYHQVRVPTSDPFTYTLSFYDVVGRSHAHYWATLGGVVTCKNWYWLQNLVTGILGPVLVKQPASLALINFVLFGAGLLALFTVLTRFGLPARGAFLLVFMLWLWPMHYGFGKDRTHYLSLLVVMLETTFFWMLFIATLSLILYASRPEKLGYAVTAALCSGLALWGRGNSLPYVAIVASTPGLAIASRAVFPQTMTRRRVLGNAIVFLAVFAGMAYWYYHFTWPAIRSYYSYVSVAGTGSVGGLFKKLTTLLHPPQWVVNNIPGIFFYSIADRTGTTVLSLCLHAIVLVAAAFVLCRRHGATTLNQSALRLGAATGLTIYVSTYFMCLIGCGPLEAHRPYHTFVPMVAGLAIVLICALAPLAFYLADRGYLTSGLFMPVLVILCLACGWLLTKKQTPLNPVVGAATPNELEQVACRLDHILQGGSLAILWYGVYNPPIFNYYRSMKELPPFRSFDKYEHPMMHTIASQVDPQDFQLALRRTMEEADFIIMPEKPEHFALVYPCSLQERGARVMREFLNSPSCPRYAVHMILHDANSCRLLLLKRLRKGETAGQFAPLPRPYPTGAEVAADFANTPSDRMTATVALVKQNADFGPEHLIDNSHTGFWEQAGPFPHLVTFELLCGQKHFRSYKVGADRYGFAGAAPRMPRGWVLKGSRDGSDWSVIDVRKNESAWKSNEVREYDIRSPGDYRYYQFLFADGFSNDIIRIGAIEMFEAGPGGYVAQGDTAQLEIRITD